MDGMVATETGNELSQPTFELTSLLSILPTYPKCLHLIYKMPLFLLIPPMHIFPPLPLSFPQNGPNLRQETVIIALRTERKEGRKGKGAMYI